MRKNKGFTLIEMLVVIAIIAILVAIVIPTVTAGTTRADAAVDAANLRSALGALNSEIMLNNEIAIPFIQAMEPTESRLHPGCKLYVVYQIPGIVDVYYVDTTNNQYYGLKYLSEMAQTGTSTVSTAEPTLDGTETWYEVGVGVIS